MFPRCAPIFFYPAEKPESITLYTEERVNG